MKNLNIEAAIRYAASEIFLPDARVAGVLVDADIGPISYGKLYGADRPAGQEFIRFQAVGTDHRNGYDIVRSASGKAYAIVTYASHAMDRKMQHLKEHIAANQDWYQSRCGAWK